MKYHHGDLRRSLIDAAVDKLRSVEARELSLRDLAREIGVSTAAFYRHFRDKDELEQCIALEGFATLLRLFKSIDLTEADGAEAIEKTVSCFFIFAHEQPGYFKMMFQSSASREHQSDLTGPAYGALAYLGAVVLSAKPGLSPAEVREQCILMCSAWYGLFRLNQAGPFFRIPEDELVRLAVTASYRLLKVPS